MLGRRRTLLLTGASRGIGHATVKKFSAEGWRVLTVSRHPFDERCPWEGGAENHVQLDLQDIRSVEDIATILKDKTEGYLDALINNAAVSPKAEDGKRMGSLQTTYNTWLGVFNVNFFSIALLAQALRSELIAARGTVINITSIAGSRVHPFAGSAYAASKAALVALTLRQFRRARQRGRPGRNRDIDPVAGNGHHRAQRNSAETAGAAARGGGFAVFPVLGSGGLYYGVGDSY
jgi:NAD(P)-dependent dehydrogenase (short-subunit alcohol dehydrogenase family)